MPIEKSPNTIYVEHLEKGELAYQFSPAAGKAVFYPRLICPFTGSDKLEWRVSKGLGTVYATTVMHPARRRALQRRADRLRRGLPADEPGRGHRPDEVKIGMRVRFRVHTPGGEDDPYPVFVPAEGV